MKKLTPKKELVVVDFIRKNIGVLNKSEIGERLGITRDKVGRLCSQYKIVAKDSLDTDISILRHSESKRTYDKKYHELIKRLGQAEKERDAVVSMRNRTRTHRIVPSVPKGTGEATAVVVASDWHIEERVKPETVNGKNDFSVDIAKERVDDFFQTMLKLLKKEQGALAIRNVILALLGDFISGNIHEELLESCTLRPIEAIMLVKDWLVSGIQFLLENSDCNFVIVCTVGNHTRITKKVHVAQERGNNLEYFMYHVIANHFKDEKRLKFIIEDSYHVYIGVYDMILRFHHGHAIRYTGGVGGLTIPVNKAIAQWNKARNADLDVFGHWHQQFDGGNFLCNGSLIGYSPFAIWIKAGYEQPKQLFFLIDKKRGKTLVAPILFNK